MLGSRQDVEAAARSRRCLQLECWRGRFEPRGQIGLRWLINTYSEKCIIPTSQRSSMGVEGISARASQTCRTDNESVGLTSNPCLQSCPVGSTMRTRGFLPRRLTQNDFFAKAALEHAASTLKRDGALAEDVGAVRDIANARATQPLEVLQTQARAVAEGEKGTAGLWLGTAEEERELFASNRFSISPSEERLDSPRTSVSSRAEFRCQSRLKNPHAPSSLRNSMNLVWSASATNWQSCSPCSPRTCQRR